MKMSIVLEMPSVGSNSLAIKSVLPAIQSHETVL